MKIIIVVPNMNLGGITISAINLANELQRCGDEVHFLDMSNKYPKETNEKLDPEIQRHFLKGKSKYWRFTMSEVRQYKGIKKLAYLTVGFFKKVTIRLGLWYKFIFSKFNECGEFDAAFAFRQCEHCYMYVLNYMPAKKKVGFVHGELTFMNDISSWKKYISRFNSIAYVSDAVKNQFVEKYPELSNNAHTVYNMFDIKAINTLAKEKTDIKFDKSIKNIVTVSRIDNGLKQIQLIPHICKNLKERTDIPFHWYIVGDGPGYEMVCELIKETNTEDVLTLVGKKNNPYNYIAKSDFTVLTSKTEAYPMVVIESFILGKPIVCTDFPSAFEMIDKNHGIICGQSTKEITEGILKILNANTLKSLTLGVCEHPVSNDNALQQLYNAINED